jgi:hypothetical protein
MFMPQLFQSYMKYILKLLFEKVTEVKNLTHF